MTGVLEPSNKCVSEPSRRQKWSFIEANSSRIRSNSHVQDVVDTVFGVPMDVRIVHLLGVVREKDRADSSRGAVLQNASVRVAWLLACQLITVVRLPLADRQNCPRAERIAMNAGDSQENAPHRPARDGSSEAAPGQLWAFRCVLEPPAASGRVLSFHLLPSRLKVCAGESLYYFQPVSYALQFLFQIGVFGWLGRLCAAR